MPYAGELVFTAFSGSHQDAIKKSLAAPAARQALGRTLHPDRSRPTSAAPTRRSSGSTRQSGKGGVAYVLEQEFGFQLPKLMHKEIGRVINDLADTSGTRAHARRKSATLSQREYLEPDASRSPSSISRAADRDGDVQLRGRRRPIDGWPAGHQRRGQRSDRRLRPRPRRRPRCRSSTSSATPSIRSARAPRRARSATSRSRRPAGPTLFGAGIDTNIELASIKAIVSALNRALAK